MHKGIEITFIPQMLYEEYFENVYKFLAEICLLSLLFSVAL